MKKHKMMPMCKKLLFLCYSLFLVLPLMAQEPEGHLYNIGTKDSNRPVVALRANLLRWATLTPDIGISLV